MVGKVGVLVCCAGGATPLAPGYALSCACGWLLVLLLT